MRESIGFARRVGISLGMVTVILLAAGCGGISGSVYIDENHNKTKDLNEPQVANIPYTLTRDGEEVAKGMTQPDGTIEESMSKSGYYCIEIDSDDLSLSAHGLKPILAYPEKQGATKPVKPASAKAVADASSDGADTNTPDTTNKTDSTDNTDNTDTTTKNEVKTTSSSSSTKQADTVESLKACSQAKEMRVKIDVPIFKSYTDRIAALPIPLEKTVSKGEIFPVVIVYPASCDLQPVGLPYGLEPAVKGSGFDPNTNLISLDMTAPPESMNISAETIQEDSLLKKTLLLKAITKDDFDGGKVAIAPKVRCPYGVVALPEQSVTIDNEMQLLVELNHVSGVIAAGEMQSITASVTNKGYSDMKGVRLVVDFPKFSQNVTSTDCSQNLIEKVSCSFDLPSQGTITKHFQFKIKQTISEETDFEVAAKAVVDVKNSETDKEFGAEPMRFSLDIQAAP